MSSQQINFRVDRDKTFTNTYVTDRLKIPKYKGFGTSPSLGQIGDEPGMEGDIILDRTTGQFCWHDGITWQCVASQGCSTILVNSDFGQASTVNCELNIVGGPGITTSAAGNTVMVTGLDNTTLTGIGCSPPLSPNNDVSLVLQGIGPDLEIRNLNSTFGLNFDPQPNGCLNITVNTEEIFNNIISTTCSPAGVPLINHIGDELFVSSLIAGDGIQLTDIPNGCITIDVNPGEFIIQIDNCSPAGVPLSNQVGNQIFISSLIAGDGIQLTDIPNGCITIDAIPTITPWEQQQELIQNSNIKLNTTTPYTSPNGGDLDNQENFLFGSDRIQSVGNTTGSDIFNPTRMYFTGSGYTPAPGSFRAGGAFGGEWDLINVGQYSVAFGQNTISSGSFSGVLSGQTNSSLGDNSSICGGQTNIINTGSALSFIGGGQENNIIGNLCVIGGGNSNVNDSFRGSIVGGGQNRIIANNSFQQASFIGGGTLNIIENIDPSPANTSFSVICGGSSNRILGYANALTFCELNCIIGGNDNLITNDLGTGLANRNIIGGGANNTIRGSQSVIFGGGSNTISEGCLNCIVVGGNNNIIFPNINSAYIGSGLGNILGTGMGGLTQFGVIMGGQTNSLLQGTHCVIGCGQNNVINYRSGFSGILSGFTNTIVMDPSTTVSSGRASVILGGENNDIVAPLGAPTNQNVNQHCVISGGLDNNISINSLGFTNNYCTIGGGTQNNITNALNSCTISGGQANQIVNSQFATISGGSTNNCETNLAKIPGGSLARAITHGQHVHANTNNFNCITVNGAPVVDPNPILPRLAQTSEYVLTGIARPIDTFASSVLKLDGATGQANQAVLMNLKSAYFVEANIVGRRINVLDSVYSEKFCGYAYYEAPANISIVMQSVFQISSLGDSLAITFDAVELLAPVQNGFRVIVNTPSGNNYSWYVVATIKTVELRHENS